MSGPIPLRRELGLLEVTLSGLGIILGAGIYVLIGEAAALSGNAVWLSFAFAALIATFTGLSYSELSSLLPTAGAEYDYTARAFNHHLAFVIGSMVILSGVVGSSTVALGFAGYFSFFTSLPILPIAAFLVLVMAALNAWGIRESAWVAILFTLIETGGLVGIIAIGLPQLGSVNYLEMPLGWGGVFTAAALIFFAYQGFEEIVKLSEETRDPTRTIPRGLILALTLSIVLYILVCLSAVSVVGWERIAASPAPFATIAGETLGVNGSTIFTLIALFATANTVLLMQIAASRITYGMARSGSLPARLSIVHLTRRTPIYAIAGVVILSLLFLLPGDIRVVAQVANFTLYFTFIVINAAVIALRYREPALPRPFKTPLNPFGVPLVPLFGLAVSLFFVTRLSLFTLGIGILLALIAAVIAWIQRNRPMATIGSS
jgi:APA family basic amino acid/polyamine antiporter